jgi:RNA polymerase sigma-70 factor (ECF subfamily)
VDESGFDQLLQRACRQDPEALSQLVELYSRRVFGLLYRLTGSRDAAEDLMQETFLRMVRTIEQYEHAGKFDSWLFRIAANLARDRARKRGRRGGMSSLDDDAGGGPPRAAVSGGSEAGPDEALSRAESGEKVAAALERLSDAEREILLLRHFSELSFREIADMLSVPLGTALARAHRALKRLKAELADEE